MAKERYNISVARIVLLLEMLFVTVATVWLIRFLRSNLNDRGAWLAAPFMLLSAAMVPTLLRKRSLGEIGWRVERLGLILWVLCVSCLVLYLFLLGGVLLLKHYHVQLPLCPVVPDGKWFSWLIYQFLYVAVAEETFFRGYLQTNMQRLLTMAVQRNHAFFELVSIILAAAIFAISHSVVSGSIRAALTFFPGLIFGWIFIKTKSLLAPILFHGLANASYAFIAVVLT